MKDGYKGKKQLKNNLKTDNILIGRGGQPPTPSKILFNFLLSWASAYTHWRTIERESISSSHTLEWARGNLGIPRNVFLWAQANLFIYFSENGRGFSRFVEITPFVGFGPQTTLDGKWAAINVASDPKNFRAVVGQAQLEKIRLSRGLFCS